MANLKDWAELLHAVAWPLVALTALIIFRRSVRDAVRDILGRIPFERTTSFKAHGLGELKMTKTTEEKIVTQTVISALEAPSRSPEGERQKQ
jgi:hypothetical protein